jgi:DNA-binding beta-propeller fold protein YncE
VLIQPYGSKCRLLFQPIGLAVDLSDNLVVADQLNNRVLLFRPGSTVAVRVWGQSSFTGKLFNGGNTRCSAVSLYSPSGLALDSTGRLWVADYDNNRVLVFQLYP